MRRRRPPPPVAPCCMACTLRFILAARPSTRLPAQPAFRLLGGAHRWMIMCPVISDTISSMVLPCDAACRRVPSVRMGPGHTTLTRMPCLPASRATQRDICKIAPADPQRGAWWETKVLLGSSQEVMRNGRHTPTFCGGVWYESWLRNHRADGCDVHDAATTLCRVPSVCLHGLDSMLQYECIPGAPLHATVSLSRPTHRVEWRVGKSHPFTFTASARSQPSSLTVSTSPKTYWAALLTTTSNRPAEATAHSTERSLDVSTCTCALQTGYVSVGPARAKARQKRLPQSQPRFRLPL